MADPERLTAREKARKRAERLADATVEEFASLSEITDERQKSLRKRLSDIYTSSAERTLEKQGRLIE